MLVNSYVAMRWALAVGFEARAGSPAIGLMGPRKKEILSQVTLTAGERARMALQLRPAGLLHATRVREDFSRPQESSMRGPMLALRVEGLCG